MKKYRIIQIGEKYWIQVFNANAWIKKWREVDYHFNEFSARKHLEEILKGTNILMETDWIINK